MRGGLPGPRLFSDLGKAILVLAALAFEGAPTSALAQLAPAPVISIEARDEQGAQERGPVFSWRTNLRPLDFLLTVSRSPGGGPAFDLYFGILIPGGRIFHMGSRTIGWAASPGGFLSCGTRDHSPADDRRRLAGT